MVRGLVKGLAAAIARGLVSSDDSLVVFATWGDSTGISWGDGTDLKWGNQ